MLPPDVASGLRLILPDQQQLSSQAQNQPVTPARQIADVLSNLIPGQRIMAEIQALLPNGNYRATVAQRDVTLALPFSAKPGDSLELEVTENDGKLTLAFVTNRTSGADAKAAAQGSVATSISTAGKLIGDLVGGLQNNGRRAAVPLNGSQPMVAAMPDTAAELAPVLKQALTQSGMFYEAHQAKWVAGKLPAEALHQEPQGKFSATPAPAAAREVTSSARPEAPATTAAQAGSTTAPPPAAPVRGGEANIPPDLVPLVRQQLDGLASNNFAWQGQIWPGQPMWWEIGEHPQAPHQREASDGKSWLSRIKLTLPSLGGIDARLSLQPGGKVSLAMVATTEAAEARLRQASDRLNGQLSAAGLDLVQLQIAHEQADT